MTQPEAPDRVDGWFSLESNGHGSVTTSCRLESDHFAWKDHDSSER